MGEGWPGQLGEGWPGQLGEGWSGQLGEGWPGQSHLSEGWFQSVKGDLVKFHG